MTRHRESGFFACFACLVGIHWGAGESGRDPPPPASQQREEARVTESDLTPISREEARAKRLKRYFDGKACRKGHVAERYVSYGGCIACSRAVTAIKTTANVLARASRLEAQRAADSRIIPKPEARSRGLKWFFTGVPCDRGHIAERMVSNGSCRACMSFRKKRRWDARRTERARQEREWQAGDPNVIGREDAMASGLKRYFTGIPCKNGHLSERFTLSTVCIECATKRSEAWRKANMEAKRRHGRRYYSANREKANERNRLYRSKNSDRIYAQNRARYAANAEERREYSRIWRKANPEIKRAYDSLRRARKRSAEGQFTASDIARIRKLQRDRCAHCRIPLKGEGTRDHIIALVNGGTNWPANIQLLCKPCNNRKHAKDPIDWARENGRLL